MVALSFEDETLQSPAPTLLFAPGHDCKPQYDTGEYVKLVLYAHLGSGSVGDAYRSRIQSNRYRPFITKIAATPARVRRLRHEYNVYRHLHDSGTRGIPLVLGFYENQSTGVSILLVSDVGHPFGTYLDDDQSVSVSEKHG